MTQRRQRMIADLQRRGLSAWTQEMSGRAIRPRAAHDHTSPACLTAADLRADVRSLNRVTHDWRRASPLALCGSKFCDAPPCHGQGRP
jgi:hypothetical protein